MDAEKRLIKIERLLEKVLADRALDSKIPLSLSEAADVCHVELRWLRERVNRKEIAAYRPCEAGSWRVFPKDVQALLMSETNQAPARRKRVLRVV